MHPLQSSNSQCATQNITHSASFRFAFTGPFPRLSFSGFFFSSPSFSTLHCSAPLFLSFPISTQCKCVFVTHSPLANGFVCNSFTSMGFFGGGGVCFAWSFWIYIWKNLIFCFFLPFLHWCAGCLDLHFSSNPKFTFTFW